MRPDPVADGVIGVRLFDARGAHEARISHQREPIALPHLKPRSAAGSQAALWQRRPRAPAPSVVAAHRGAGPAVEEFVWTVLEGPPRSMLGGSVDLPPGQGLGGAVGGNLLDTTLKATVNSQSRQPLLPPLPPSLRFSLGCPAVNATRGPTDKARGLHPCVCAQEHDGGKEVRVPSNAVT